ncbi:hypothetical protein CJ20_105 [Escherichia phage CJ20]|nr:hypothetical protein CJ20_105 [Escherichia phage CJ20]
MYSGLATKLLSRNVIVISSNFIIRRSIILCSQEFVNYFPKIPFIHMLSTIPKQKHVKPNRMTSDPSIQDSIICNVPLLVQNDNNITYLFGHVHTFLHHSSKS